MASKKKTSKSQRRKADASTARKKTARKKTARKKTARKKTARKKTANTGKWVVLEAAGRVRAVQSKTAKLSEQTVNLADAVAQYEMALSTPSPFTEGGWSRRLKKLDRLSKKIQTERDRLGRLLKK